MVYGGIVDRVDVAAEVLQISEGRCTAAGQAALARVQGVM